MSSPSHVPVMLDRVVALLAPALEREGAVLVDGTLGLGGHSEAVLQRFDAVRVVGIDRDPQDEVSSPLPRHLGHLPRFQVALPLRSTRERAGTWFGGSPDFGQQRVEQRGSRQGRMSIAPLPVEEEAPVRRVRHQARDAAALMAFSAATSVVVAVGFLLLALLARQA